MLTRGSKVGPDWRKSAGVSTLLPDALTAVPLRLDAGNVLQEGEEVCKCVCLHLYRFLWLWTAHDGVHRSWLISHSVQVHVYAKCPSARESQKRKRELGYNGILPGF